MSDAQCIISMARINLVDNVKYFWIIIVRDVELRLCPPILSWNQMRDILKKEYVPASYMDDLLDQFLNLRYSTVIEYMFHFEALMSQCEVDEEQKLLLVGLKGT